MLVTQATGVRCRHGCLVCDKFICVSIRFMVFGLAAPLRLSRQSNRCATYSATNRRHGHENYSGLSAYRQLRHLVLALAAAQKGSFCPPTKLNLCDTSTAAKISPEASVNCPVWRRSGLFGNSRAMPLNGLAPVTLYQVQVRTIGGSTCYSDWSDSVSHMSI